MPEANALFIRRLDLKTAVEKWSAIARDLFSGRTISGNFTTTLERLTANYSGTSRDLTGLPDVVRILRVASDEAAKIECFGFLISDGTGNQATVVRYIVSDDMTSARIVATHGSDADRQVEVVTGLARILEFVPRHVLAMESVPRAHQEALSYEQSLLAELRSQVTKIAEFNLKQAAEQAKFVDRVTVEFQERSQKQQEEARESVRKQREEADEAIRKQREEADEAIRKQREELAAREEQHKQTVAEWDAKQNMAARRALLERIQGLLSTQANFKLSDDTQKKRWPIHGLCIGALLGGVAFAGFWARQIAQTPDPRWFHFTPLSAGVIFVVSTLVYYVKWNDQWFREHAQAEMRNKKLGADILRASWLAELFLEGKEHDRQLPDLLVTRFSDGLFQDVSMNGPEHPADQMVDLVKKLSAVEVGKDGVKITKTAAKE
jgi:hypothetical protein